LIQLNDCKEEFSYAYIQAIASVKGLVVEKRGRIIDNQGIDITISYPIEALPRIDAQVKCTAQDIVINDEVVYDLPINNYNSLKNTNIIVPRILIIVLVPEQIDDWVAVKTEETILKKCAYWFSLRGMEDTKNQNTVRVKIPLSNLITPDSLKELLETVNRRQNI
jgi:hypothetical protein